LIHKRTNKNGRAKLKLSNTLKILRSLQYLSESKCILAMRRPGKVKRAPTTPHVTAMKNFMTIFDAGPLEFNPWLCKKLEAPSLKLLYAFSNPISNVFSGTIRIIIAINRYVNPVTIQVDLSPIDSSLLKYWIVREASNLLRDESV
jgi:hypothetical protein